MYRIPVFKRTLALACSLMLAFPFSLRGYVFERFTSAYLDENEKDLTKQCLALTRRLSHRQLGERNGSTILFEKETDRLTSSLSKLSPRIANAIERIKKEK